MENWKWRCKLFSVCFVFLFVFLPFLESVDMQTIGPIFLSQHLDLKSVFYSICGKAKRAKAGFASPTQGLFGQVVGAYDQLEYHRNSTVNCHL